MIGDDDLRDCFAMFAMNGIIARGGLHPELIPEEAMARRSYEVADAMLKARNAEPETEVGIVAAKTRRKK
jgi:hypothetical protein